MYTGLVRKEGAPDQLSRTPLRGRQRRGAIENSQYE